jgi:hypothetical protein
MGGHPLRLNMNWSKNLYTFMLGAIIVLSGCMGAGTTEGMEEDDAGGTTVINNYYNNTTEVISEIPEMIALGGFVLGEVGGGHNFTASINTTAGQMMKINEARIDCVEACYIKLETTCTDDVSFSLYVAHGQSTSWFPDTIVEGYVSGSAFDCTHTIDIYDGNSVAQNMSWSFVYSIGPVTVG